MPDPARVLVVAPQFAGPGGIEHVSRLACEALLPAARRNSGHVEGRALLNGTWSRDIPVVSAHGSRVRLVSTLLQDAVSSGPDTLVMVMHVHFAPLLLPASYKRARIVLWLHGIEIDRPLTASERWLAQRASQIIAVSQHTASLWRRHNPQLRQADVCHLGVADAAVPDSAASAPPLALIVARMAAEERYKGHDALIDAWTLVQARVPDAKLVIVGDGDDRPRLEARVREAGLEQAIVFTGSVGDDQVRQLHAQSACYVMPSAHEGFGLAFLEAMRARRPCVAATGAAQEIVEHGTSGFIVSPGDVEGLTAAITRLLDDASLRGRMGDAARARYEQHFTAAKFGERLRKVLAR